ncbi:MAG: ferrochelatase [Planctomycetaceae bacterium]|jgi:ferrochelatase|nr:ferrochelatase [Planctomycetaceae bacterium]
MDALLIISYGAPEREEDVFPFLHNLFAGKNVPPQRLEYAAEKYRRCAAQSGSYSPLNGECLQLIAGVRNEFKRRNQNIPVYWGNLFHEPLLKDTLEQMQRSGIAEAGIFVTSAFSCNSRYNEALQSVKNITINLKYLPLPNRNRLFLEAQTDTLLTALAHHSLTDYPSSAGSRLVLFSAHSLPKSDPQAAVYAEELQEACRSIAELSQEPFDWELVYQSAGVPADRWLEPDIKDRIRSYSRQTAAAGLCRSVIVSPIGFFCENMETHCDLDIETGQLCGELALGYCRAAAVGAAPKICRMIADYCNINPTGQWSLPKIPE